MVGDGAEAVLPLVNRPRRSFFLLGDTGAGATAGIENPTTADLGRAFLTWPFVVVGFRRDAHDFFTGGGAAEVDDDEG